MAEQSKQCNLADSTPNGSVELSAVQRSGRSVLWIPVIFVSATFILYNLSVNFPQQSANSNSTLMFPSSFEELTSLSEHLRMYKDNHFVYVLTVFCCAYIYKQTFAIPGSVFLNVLAGALFGAWSGFLLTCILSACGATFCYLLSDNFAKSYLIQYFPEKINYFQKKVEENMTGLFFYLLFLRLFPMSPNWFMNMVSPIVGVPASHFFLSVFIGLMPYNFICTQTGSILAEVSSLNDIFSLWTMLQMAVLAFVALVPSFLIKKIHQAKIRKEL